MQNCCDDARRIIMSFLRWPHEMSCLSAVSPRWLHVTDPAKIRWLERKFTKVRKRSRPESDTERVIPNDFAYIAAFSKRPALTSARAVRAFAVAFPETNVPDTVHYLKVVRMCLDQCGSLAHMRKRIRISKRARRLVLARRFPNTSAGHTRSLQVARKEDERDRRQKKRKHNSRWNMWQSYDVT